jgi:hypothetical protein
MKRLWSFECQCEMCLGFASEDPDEPDLGLSDGETIETETPSHDAETFEEVFDES